jgi:hypothetical protein
VATAPTPESSPKSSLWRNPGFIAGVTAACVLVLALAAWGVLRLVAAGSHTIRGSITLYDSDNSADADSSCSGSGGYDDLDSGGSVTVTDEHGDVIGSSNLKPGTGDEIGGCVFKFSVSGVRDAKFYTVSAGNNDRGGPRYSKHDMESADWNVDLSIGDPF